MLLIPLIGIGFVGCGSGISGAFDENLSGGYVFYWNELSLSGIIRDSPSYKYIPNYVVEYEFDNDFIIASHKDCVGCTEWGDFDLYDEVELDYYIISHKMDSVFGPLTKKKYNKTREELGVPKDLMLNN
ncbi:MAG: DUF3997 domain-containing protein [Flavobacteriales bacterium]|nr:DUF3997 domain-containing protein [Flavobacteriales bacterium]